MAEKPEDESTVDWAQNKVEGGWNWVKNGGYNWPIAIGGMALGFLGSVAAVNSLTGGGFLSTVIGVCIGATVAMFGGVLAVKLFHDGKEMLTSSVKDKDAPQAALAQEPQTQVSQAQHLGHEVVAADITSLGELPSPAAPMAQIQQNPVIFRS